MELISYASDFVSFLIQNLKETESIKAIILFGSVARGEATKKSDVDIFIDLADKEELISKKANEIKDNFFSSAKFKLYWKVLGVKNEISIFAGHLENWKLKDSMLGNAVILYQKYAPKLEGGKSKAILSWGNIKPDSRRVMLNRKIFGYNYYGKFYKGIIERYNGKKLGANVVMIDIEGLNSIVKIFKNFKAAVKILRVFEYS